METLAPASPKLGEGLKVPANIADQAEPGLRAELEEGLGEHRLV